ncbi:MAG: cation transporter [Gammaproteobacteria bacterium]|jgi:cation diffusion facilitator family transporter|nr:cation transporter [Gammaproteobacteria bacterium]MBT3859490.1 cation transporter [Gammaproteobacteria bacterium]MBT3986616.1 cation transporter [Gammaproteobacteria bacterium]MBT4255080.1 cation transporter [Gammaproteobacteria bacterium]MBT4581391.1 cation transporter [Gammaproteobacteria bacterium]
MNTLSPKQEATRVTLIGMWLDIAIGLAKILGGVFFNSFALITDGIHSLTDAVTDVFVLIVARISHEGPDDEHQYGHGRFETLGTIGMGVVFFITAGILLYDSYYRLRDSESIPTPALAAILIAIISIASKEWIYRYTMSVAKRLNSSLLKANAWHSRSDAISSIAVLIGLIAAQQGYVWMDTVAAIVVALIIAKIGWELCADALSELVDTAVPDHRKAEFETCVLEIDGIQGITNLRSRISGGKIILEVRLQVNPRISVSEGHQLGELASRSLIGRFSDISEVIPHIDPVKHSESGEHPEHHMDFPSRGEIIQSVRDHWAKLLKEEDVASIDLHYLNQGVEIDLVLNQKEISPELTLKLRAALDDISYVSCLRIFNKLSETRLDSRLS